MEIKFDQEDENFLTNINKDLKEGKKIPLFANEVGVRYFIDFTCRDIPKANLFIRTLMGFSQENRAKLEDGLGISVNSIRFCEGDGKLRELKEMLQNFLNEIERIENDYR